MGPDERAEGSRDGTLLRERAAALSRAGRTAPERPTRPAVVFCRGGRRYALDSRLCLGVTALLPGAVLALPDLPRPLSGYTLFRGEPLALFDLAALFGAASIEPNADEAPALRFALVLGTDRPRLGLWAEEVEEVSPLDAALFAPGAAGAAEDPLLLGTAERLQVLDADRLLRDERFLIDQGD